MKEIINRYHDKNSDYIFPVLKDVENCSEDLKWKMTRSALAKYNKSLKRITRSYISQLDYSDIKEANRKILSRFTKNAFTDAENQNRNVGNNA
jgi:hypothetical protein